MAKAPSPGSPSGVRLAATAIVLRGAAAPPDGPPRRPASAELELFMVRRSARSPFMPDTFVFPGGALDAEDGPAEDDATFEAAARRETREEASIDLSGCALRWFDTWLTPSGEGRRYLARFFAAHIDHATGCGARPDGHETTAGFWATPAGVLDRWRAGEVDLPPPTLSVLLGLAGPRAPTMLARDPAELRTPILPKLTAVGSELHIVLPHDPEYPALDGDSAPAPPRVHDLPRRFVRAPRSWQPR